MANNQQSLIMGKQIKFYQFSAKTNAIALREMQWADYGALLQIVKKNGGKWNIALSQFEFPIQNTGNMIKDIRMLDENLIIKEVPTHNLKALLFQPQAEDERRMSMVPIKTKRVRQLVLDPLLLQRYEHVSNYLKPSTTVYKDIYKRILLVCWQKNHKQWVDEVMKKKHIYNKEVDYEALSEQSANLLSSVLTEHEINILYYQKLEEYMITKKMLQKYHTVICDDCQSWLNSQNKIYSAHNASTYMPKILKELVSHERDLILITASLNLQDPNEMLEIGNILKPKQFGIDMLRAMYRETNDANWIKKRYNKDNKVGRELLYLLQSSVLILPSKCRENEKKGIRLRKAAPLSYECRIVFEPSHASVDRLNGIKNRYRHVSTQQILKKLQQKRSRDSYFLGEGSKLEDAKFLRQIREAMLMDKYPYLTKQLYHLVKELGQRTILIVQSVATQQKVEKFLVEQQVPYLIYEISNEQIKRGYSYRFNTSKTHKLCILVRDKLQQQYRKCKNQVVTELEEAMQRQAERQLGIEKGHLYQLALHHRDKLNNPLFKKDQMVQLPKLISARHLIIFDTYWYQFSEEKESIINNIFKTKLQFFPEVSQETAQPCAVEKKIEMVKHYFINCQTVDNLTINKYNLQANAHEDEQDQAQVQDQEEQQTLEQFTKSLFEMQKQRLRNKTIISEVYDVDDQFDKFEFQNMKAMEQDDDKPRYNTHIPGLIVETPCLFDKQKSTIEFAGEDSMKMIPQKQDNISNVSWLHDNEESDQQSNGGIDLRPYLAQTRVNQQISEEFLRKGEEARQKMEQLRAQRMIEEQSDDSFAQSICINIKQPPNQYINEADATIKKEMLPMRQKLTIDDIPDIIEIDDDSNIYPMNIVQNRTSSKHNQSSYKQFQQSNNYQSYQRPIKEMSQSYFGTSQSYFGTSQSYHPQPNSFRPNQSNQQPKKRRMPPTPGCKMWGNRANSNVEKIIAPKCMDLKIKLKPSQSALRR